MIRASILKFDQEITVARIRQAIIVLWKCIRLSIQKLTLFLLGASKISFGQVFFFIIKFVLYLPKWESGDKNLCTCTCSTLLPSDQDLDGLQLICQKLECNSLQKEIMARVLLKSNVMIFNSHLPRAMGW